MEKLQEIKCAIILMTVLFAYVLNAFADAIDHGKGSANLYELWHILKALSYGILIGIILWLMKVPIIIWILMLVILWVWWRFFYQLARYYEFWKLDDKIDIPWLRKIWEIKR